MSYHMTLLACLNAIIIHNSMIRLVENLVDWYVDRRKSHVRRK